MPGYRYDELRHSQCRDGLRADGAPGAEHARRRVIFRRRLIRRSRHTSCRSMLPRRLML